MISFQSLYSAENTLKVILIFIVKREGFLQLDTKKKEGRAAQTSPHLSSAVSRKRCTVGRYSGAIGT